MGARKLNILIWADNFLPQIGGLELACAQITEQYRLHGHRILLLTTTRAKNNVGLDDSAGFKIYRYNFTEIKGSVTGDLRQLKICRDRLNELVLEFKPDLIHFHNAISHESIFSWLLLKSLSLPKLATLHMVPKKFESDYIVPMYDVYQDYDAINCVSHVCAKILLEKIPQFKNKVTVIYNSIFIRDIVLQLPDFKNIKLLCIARLEEQKNMFMAIDVVAELKKKYQHLKLYIAGDGTQRNLLEDLVRERQLEEQIIFLGWVQPENMLELINSMSIVISTSHEENCSVAALESIYMARPLVSTDTLGAREIIQDKKTGFICPHGDIDAFVNAVSWLIENPEQAIQMGLESREYFKEKFSAEQTSKQYEDLLMRVIEKKEIVYDGIS